MTTERDVRTHFSFHPPEGDGGAWRATLESLERALREAFPELSVERRGSGVRGTTVLDFEIEPAPGVWVDGTAALTPPDYAYVVLVDATADEAAAFAVWLRDSFVPAPHLVRFASSLAMANGAESPEPLPPGGGREAIGGLLRRHLEAFDH
ncbi:hypothetical protein [Streptomyces sp. bgisy082]|uniref:hypothetical protein n=1 Tax=Streptomyces sp. bgisy082 TaxID=3413776 RepID=UPI003D71B4CD